MQAAGFALDAKSDILRNMDDDYSKNMADPAVRGHTDRFVMRFVKPE
jgi:predicted methyltransferase